jgi:hypothetical protein
METLHDSFQPVHIEPLNGNTQMLVEIRDDPELYGVLDRLERLGLSIVSMRPAGATEASIE